MGGHDLTGQVALVTGGATGIGRAMAAVLGTAGAKLWIASRNEIAIERAIEELRMAGLAADGRRLDVTDRQQIESVVDKVMSRDGKIDILFNAAGVMCKYPLLEMPEEIWDQSVEVNLKGAFLCTQAVARGMVARNYGRIIHVSSGHVRGNANNAAYSAAKGGLESLIKSFALELSQRNLNVTINAIEPGGTDTAMWRRGKSAAYISQALKAGRVRRPDAMGKVVLFLASSASRAVNGKIIAHDQQDWMALQGVTNEYAP